MPAYELTYEYTDDDGDVATHSIFIPDTFSLAQYTEFGRALAVLIDPVVHGLISGLSFTVSIDLSALTNNTIDGASDVDDVAAFQFLTAGGKAVSVNIPAMFEGIVSAGSDDIDVSDVDVAAFRTAMASGIAVTGGTVTPCDVQEVDIVSLVYARENFRPSGRRR